MFVPVLLTISEDISYPSLIAIAIESTIYVKFVVARKRRMSFNINGSIIFSTSSILGEGNIFNATSDNQ